MRRAAILPLVLLTGAQNPATAIEGRWRSPGGNSIIDVAPCGGSLCGTVVWASEQARQAARKGTDQLIGTQVLTSLTESGAGRWQGKLFIPDKNMRVSAKIQLTEPQQIKVSGCLAGRALCKSELWTRFDQALPADQ